MNKRFIIPFPFSKTIVLAVIGLITTAYFITHQTLSQPEPEPIRPPAVRPFNNAVAGTGMIEPANEAVAVSPNFSGKVTKVFVKEGDFVQAGTPLFALDSAVLQAQLTTLTAQAVAARSRLAAAQARMAKLQHQPRSEDIPPLQAKVSALQASLQKELSTLERLEGVEDSRAVNQNELTRQRLTVQEMEANVTQARAELEKALAGAWKYDVDEAKQGVAEATATLAASQSQQKELQVQLAQSVVKAPKAGEVLQVNIRAGETVQLMKASGESSTAILLGDTKTLQVRVDIDEVLASEVKPNMPAVAFIKGASQYKFPLQFLRVEPHMIPKKNLTGATAERNDVRVLQLIYTFTPPKGFNVYTGQQLEVYLNKGTATPTLAEEANTMQTPEERAVSNLGEPQSDTNTQPSSKNEG
ncbi:MAG: biotin/lipoyl-binding protein [Vampirovibrio sp.]|nr:biotin/lipoyl-binding protein [Vampirovibrio sp.]